MLARYFHGEFRVAVVGDHVVSEVYTPEGLFFKELEQDLTFIEIEYGKILAFDQSLPHGYITNSEEITHWSLNCRFKSVHTPYWDKKLGEYFMPITIKTCSRLGATYEHPYNWLET